MDPDTDTTGLINRTAQNLHGTGLSRPVSTVRKPIQSEPQYRPPYRQSGSDGWRTYQSESIASNLSHYERLSQPFDASQELPKHDGHPILPQQNSVVKHMSVGPSIRELAFQCIIHILPVLVTAVLIVLNQRNAYWQDVDATKMQTMVLQSFQFPIKAHELLMTASVAAIILHRVRYDLLVRQDLPLGFLTSPYRIGEIRYLFSYEFRGASSAMTDLRQLALPVLIIMGTILTFVVGPSSGVLMIPKLNWWNVRNPFGADTEALFYNTTRERHWPSTIPGYSCGSWGCPNAGEIDLTTWGQNLIREHVTPQITYFGGSSFHRVVTSNSTNYTDGWTATTSLLMRDAEAISSFWNYVLQFNRDPMHLRRPRLTPKFVSGEDFLKPLVQVQCSAQEAGHATEFPHYSLQGTTVGMYKDVNWPISASDAAWTPNPIESLTFNLSSTDGFSNEPTLAGIFHVVRAEDQQPMIVPCSILMHWVPTVLWIDPKADLNSHDSTQNPLQAFLLENQPTWRQISLSNEWLDMMGTQTIEDILSQLVLADAGMLRNGTEGLSWRLSTLLGLWLTDNVARFTNETSVISYHHGKDGEYTFSDNGILNYGPGDPPEGYSSWTEYLSTNPVMKITIEVDRFGYGWAFRGNLIKGAAVVLLLQALLALSHLAILFHSRWTSTACSSVGSVVALTLRSDVMKKSNLAGSNPHGDKRRLWSVPVGASKDFDDNLQLVPSLSSSIVGHGEVIDLVAFR